MMIMLFYDNKITLNIFNKERKTKKRVTILTP